jgi:hypothetical protein
VSSFTLRMALSGRSGQGELDRVVLLLDDGAAAGFSVPVKTARARIIEFCSAPTDLRVVGRPGPLKRAAAESLWSWLQVPKFRVR